MNKINKKSVNELLNDIAARIKTISDNDISQQQAMQGARRFVQFCQKLMDIQIRIEMEKDEKYKKDN